MKLYISGVSVIVLIVFYLPLVIWIMRRIWGGNLQSGAKASAMILVAIVAYIIPLGDVTVNSVAMAKVCPTAGLHIYKTVEVEGYAGMVSGDILKRYPYSFVENESYGKWVRWEWQDNEIKLIRGVSPKSEYEITSDTWHPDPQKRVEVMRDIIRHRMTGEILADDLKYQPLPSWIDRLFLFSWAGYWSPGNCGSKQNIYQIVHQVLLPKTQSASGTERH